MVEPKDIQETRIRGSLEYSELVSEIDKDPYNPKVWDRVLGLAKSEEGAKKAQVGFYGHVPLGEMIKTAERLRKAKNFEDKYRILAEKCSTGEFWYDIVLGRVDDQLLHPMGEEIGVWKDRSGKPSGKREWEKALDIGSGKGNSLREIQKYAKQAVSVDRLSFLLQTARSHPDLQKTPMVVADALRLPFPDGTFDLVSSSGLTFYLSKDQLPQFVDEVSRVLEPGGSYFQSYTMPPGENGIIHIEREYLTSGKGVLACLMDKLVTKKYAENEEEQSEFSLLCGAFEERGFTRVVTIHESEGVVVLEFKKKLPEAIENLRRFYLMGETKRSSQIASRLIYGQEVRGYSTRARAKYSTSGIIKEGLLPPKVELIKVLELIERVAAEQEVVDKNSGQEYLSVFIKPIVDLAISDAVDPEVRETAAGTLSKSLERLYEGKIQKHTLAEWDRKGISMALGQLRELVKDRSGCEEVMSQIDAIISESSLK